MRNKCKQELSQQIRGCNAVIVVAGMYTLYSEWINYEIDEALRMKKPIIGIKPWGNQRIPEKIQQNATVLVGWNSSSLVSAVRNYALQGDDFMKKTCFVVMGFGKKMDYRNSKEIDLDLIYKQVIKIEAGYKNFLPYFVTELKN